MCKLTVPNSNKVKYKLEGQEYLLILLYILLEKKSNYEDIKTHLLQHNNYLTCTYVFLMLLLLYSSTCMGS